jgi:hypothetical protein
VAGHVALKVLVHTETLASKLRKAHHKSPAALQEATGTASTKTAPKKAAGRGKKTTKEEDEVSDDDVHMDFESDEENAAPKANRGKGKATKASVKATGTTAATSGTRTSSRARTATKYSESEWASDDEEAVEAIDEGSEEDEPKPRKGRKTTTAPKKPAAKPKKTTKSKQGAAETKSDDEAAPETTADKPSSLQAELGLNAAAEEADNELMTDIAENNIVFRCDFGFLDGNVCLLRGLLVA